MEIVIVIGMVAAFFAGAYIREPFKRKKEEKPAQVRPIENGQEKDRQAEQLNNLMNYNGRKQYPEEEK